MSKVKKSVYFAIGHGTQTNSVWDPGCVYGNYTEAELMKPIVGEAVAQLKRHGIEVYTDWPKNNLNMTYTVRDANKLNVGVYIAAHCDWKNAPSGTLPITYDDTIYGDELCRCINEAVTSAMGLKTRAYIKSDDYYEVSKTNMTACIFETGSIKNDLAVLKQWEKYGIAMAKGILEFFDVAWVPEKVEPAPTPVPTPVPPTYTGAYWKVQVGAFSKEANADTLAAELKKKGYSTFKVLDDGLYKIQTGAFTNEANANKQAAKLNAAGYKTYIHKPNAKPASSNAKKNDDQHWNVARSIINEPNYAGYGTDKTRVARLTAAGYDADIVQKYINILA